MNYELLLKLKKAGFPFRIATMDTAKVLGVFGGADFGSHTYTPPSLSELIDACGEFGLLRTLEEQRKGKWCAGMGEWSDAFGWEYKGRGSTPAEAVANLWLALNEK